MIKKIHPGDLPHDHKYEHAHEQHEHIHAQHEQVPPYTPLDHEAYMPPQQQVTDTTANESADYAASNSSHLVRPLRLAAQDDVFTPNSISAREFSPSAHEASAPLHESTAPLSDEALIQRILRRETKIASSNGSEATSLDGATSPSMPVSTSFSASESKFSSQSEATSAASDDLTSGFDAPSVPHMNFESHSETHPESYAESYPESRPESHPQSYPETHPESHLPKKESAHGFFSKIKKSFHKTQPAQSEEAEATLRFNPSFEPEQAAVQLSSATPAADKLNPDSPVANIEDQMGAPDLDAISNSEPDANGNLNESAFTAEHFHQEQLSHHQELQDDLLDRTREELSIQKISDRDVELITRQLKRKVRGKPTRPYHSSNPLTSLALGAFTLFKFLLVCLFVCVLFAVSIGVGTLIGNVALTDPLPTSLFLGKGGDQTSFVYDAEGTMVAKLTGAQNIDREYIPLSSVENTKLVDAFISTEDEQFRDNIGIAPRRIISAVLSALSNGGEARHGGSTITQQTVKLLTGEDQRSVQRKIQEWYRAIMLTKQLTKDEIMELYINLVPMANSYVGVQTASKAYFGKTASELNIAEAAYLAGVPKSPTTYNPRSERGRRNGLRRQRQVLANMVRLGMISDDEYHQALNQDLIFIDKPEEVSPQDVNSYFVEYAIKRVRQDLIEKLGYSDFAAGQLIGGGGLRIYLTLDPKIQAIVDEVYADHNNFESFPGMFDNEPERPQSGGVIIDNQTHHVVAIAGGVGAKTQNLVLNRGTDISRQPGSTIKPVGVYAPAIDQDIYAGSTLMSDSPQALDPERPNEIWPYNYSNTFSGPVLLRFALKESLNTTSVQALRDVGVDLAKSYLQNNGWDLTGDESQLSLAVGALTTGISPLELSNSFATFANNGIWHEPVLYTRVLDSDGNVVLEEPNETRQVFKPSTAFIMTNLLQEVTRSRLSNSPHWGVAAQYGQIQGADGVIQTGVKTGTSDNSVDQWATGLTPYYTAGFWYGFDNATKTSYISEADSYKVLNVFYQIMRAIHQDLPAAKFEMPEGVVAVEVSAYSGQRANSGTYSSGSAYTEYYDENSSLIPTGYDTYVAPTEANESENGNNNENGGNGENSGNGGA